MISHKLQYALIALVVAILGMGFYLIHLKHKAEYAGNAPEVQALTPPVNGPTEQITLWIASDETNSVRPETILSALPSDPGELGKLALHTLIARSLQKDSTHPLGAGADVQDVFLPDAASAVVNLNAQLADTHRSGVEVEQLTVFSMVLTLKAQLPQITRVRFLVEGKTRDTLAGHIDLTGWFDVASVAQATKSLQ